jgi:serine/threonine-protein kinase
MAEPLRLTESDPREAEEKLGRALVTRGLITLEELNRCKTPPNRPAGLRQLLEALVRGGHLAESQKKRVWQEMESLTEQLIPGYQMIEPIGQGSMGKVFKARQVSMDRMVAIKILHPRLARRKDFLERHKREAQICARLSHPNLINAIDVGQAGEIHYFVMELAEGKTLRDDLDAGQIFEEEDAINIVVKVAKALEHAHAKGLVHRDVKPANIVVMNDGTVKLADLGMAQDTADEELIQSEKGQRIGTPYYMAPEQINSHEAIDGRTDLYGLGATLYHMVTGRPPFPSQKVDKVLHDHLNRKATPAHKVNEDVSKDLSAVITKLLQKDPARRYASATDLLADLYDLLAGERPTIALGPKAKKKKGSRDVEIDEDDEPRGPGEIPHSYWLLVAALGGFLIVSVIVNLILLRRG